MSQEGEHSLFHVLCIARVKNVTEPKMKKDIKGSQLKEVRSITGLALPSKMLGQVAVQDNQRRSIRLL